MKLNPSELCKWEYFQDGRFSVAAGIGYVTGHTTLGGVAYTFVTTAKGSPLMIPTDKVEAR